jgi:hypothetical protein
VLAAAVSGCGGAARGPFGAMDFNPSAVTIRAAVGEPVSTGLLSLTNPSGSPLVLERITLVGGRGGLVLVGAGVVHEPFGLDYLGRGYPPRNLGAPLHPFEGWVVAPTSARTTSSSGCAPAAPA